MLARSVPSGTILAEAFDYVSGHRIAKHRHRRAQLVHASSGIMRVTTSEGTWVVPPERAVWVPPETDHEIAMTGDVLMRTLYMSSAVRPDLPSRCCVVNVSPLFRELILHAVKLPQPYPDDGPESRLFTVLLDQIALLGVAPLHLPIPDHHILRVVTDALLADPSDNRSLEDWAETAAASGRTLARLFRRETGMTFGVWRQQLRLLRALELLAAGESITTIAFELGYESLSAFIAMFRRSLGQSPRRYFSRPSSPPE